MRWMVVGGLITAFVTLAGCGGPERPQVRAEPIPACEPYRSDPTAFSRCRLFASGLGDDLIPEAGRTASLDAQVRCAPLRTSPEYYLACIEAAPPGEPNPDTLRAGFGREADAPTEGTPQPAPGPFEP